MKVLHPKLIIGLLLAMFFAGSLCFRIWLPYDQIFSADWIKLSTIDGYYYMRLVDNMAFNFPGITGFDPFFIYPGGNLVGEINFFYRLLAGFIWLISAGSPTQHTIDVVGVFFPPLLAALTVIPVYFIGKALFNRWAGVLAAALIAIFPGEWMGRSILGFGDTCVVETLFTTTALAFLITAIKIAGERQLTFNHLIQRDWKVVLRPLILSILAGIFLGFYLITWLGALLFVFIIALYFIIQFIIDHLRHRSSDHLGFVGFIMFLIALIIFIPSSPAGYYSLALVVAVFIPVVLSGISLLISGRGLKTVYYPLTVIGLGAVFLAIFYAIAPDTLGVMWSKFTSVFAPGGATAVTTMEMRHFLSPQGSFSPILAWGMFTTSFFFAPWWLILGFCFAALCGYIYRMIREGGNEKPLLIFLALCVVIMIIVTIIHPPDNYQSEEIWPIPGFALISFVVLIWLFIRRRGDEGHRMLFFIWTLVTLAATLSQQRFAYYSVVNIALLSGYISWQIIWLVGIKKLAAGEEEVTAKTGKPGKEKKSQGWRGITTYHINAGLAVILVFFLVLFPNIVKAKEVAIEARFAPSDAWQESLVWMKTNTPDPLGDPDAYYKIYDKPTAGKRFTYPESAYGVTSWWDYGYWITRVAHRLPSTNPSQASEPIKKVAGLFLTRDESLAAETMEELDSSYVIIDYDICTGKFWAVVTWAGREQSDFIGVYYLPYEGELVPVQFFYPEYYYTMLVRLYNFGGQAVTDVNPLVITYEEKVDLAGKHYNEIVNFEEFTSYQDALDYIENQESGNHRLVGINPFICPVPLEAVQNYNLIFSSTYGITNQDGSFIPEVRIFEYTGDR